MADAINFDLQHEADVQGDAHDLSVFPDGRFDVVVCTAVLQYCERPHVVVAEITRVLSPGGLVYIDVPWVQPDCRDGRALDRWRFSEHGLRTLFADSEVLELGVSIPASSALAFHVARALPRPLGLLMRPLLWALSATRLGRRRETAGGLYLIAKTRS
jgi:ubiquinone/menaquinone biosynthesis C-methylase UbiE